MRKSLVLFAIIGVFLIFSVTFIETATPTLTKTKKHTLKEEKIQILTKDKINKIDNNERYQKIIEFFEKIIGKDVETQGIDLFILLQLMAVFTLIASGVLFIAGSFILPLLPLAMALVLAAAFFSIMGIVALFIEE